MILNLELPLFLARRIERVAEKKKIPFQEAAIFLLKKVLSPRQKNFAGKGVITSGRAKAEEK